MKKIYKIKGGPPMWFRLNLNGIIMNMRIKGYEPSEKDKWDYQWCDVDFSFIGESWLNYQRDNDEVLLSCEVEELAQAIDDLITDKLSEVKTIECIEPDFNFILHPKRDLRNDSKYTYVRKGYEMVDIYMDMKISFWHEGLTDNFLSVTFDRNDLQYLRNYLYLVVGKLNWDDKCIADMLK
jgi:hypothetical protein